MIQDLFPRRFHTEYRPKVPGPNSVILWFEGENVLARQAEGRLEFPRFEDCPGLAPDQLSYLFRIDEEEFFLCPGADAPPPQGFLFVENEVFRHGLRPKAHAFAGLTALQVARWYRGNRFCGRCGGPMRHSPRERMVLCPRCGSTVYPKISPVVIVGVRDGENLLMTRYAGRSYGGYALIAGFIEVGETPEDAARREAFEETGLRIKNLSYCASQPWGYSDSLLLGFFADLDGDGAITLEEDELSMAQWVPRGEIAVQPDDFSLTNHMICLFRDGKA